MRREGLGGGFRGLDEDASAVQGVRHPAGEALALEPVDQAGDGGRGQPRVLAQFARGQGAVAQEQVDGLLLGGAQAVQLRDRGVEHDGGRAELPAGRVQPGHQLAARGLVGGGHGLRLANCFAAPKQLLCFFRPNEIVR